MILLPNIFPISFPYVYLNVIPALPCRQLAQSAWNLRNLRAHHKTRSIVTDYPKSGLETEGFFSSKNIPTTPFENFRVYWVLGRKQYFRESQKNSKEFLQKPQNVEFIITKKLSTVHGLQNFHPGRNARFRDIVEIVFLRPSWTKTLCTRHRSGKTFRARACAYSVCFWLHRVLLHTADSHKALLQVFLLLKENYTME